MSNDIINIRFGTYHFHIKRDFPWFEFGHNPYQAQLRREDPNWKWFQVHK